MIRQWLHERRRRIEHSRAAIETTLHKRERIHRQWPEVREHVGFSREQRQINHLSELILNIHRGS